MSVMLSPFNMMRPVDGVLSKIDETYKCYAPSSRRGWASLMYTSAASSITRFMNSSKPYISKACERCYTQLRRARIEKNE
jgi:hypothetical protein